MPNFIPSVPASAEREIDPEDYFANLKKQRHESTEDFIIHLQNNTEELVKKAHALGQTYLVKKLLFTLDILSKERQLCSLGFTSFVYRDDIEYYMDKVSDKAVKIIELENYPREIPSSVAEALLSLKDKKLFDVFYIVFTDYTGQTEREVQAERKRKDPILFGAFSQRNATSRFLHDRFYYIADWEDEYCDLTLDKMVAQMAKQGKEIVQPSGIESSDIDSIRKYVSSLEAKGDEWTMVRKSSIKKSFFDRIKFWK